MKLKEIKQGMAIHCKNDEEKKALLEEAERLGYLWPSGRNAKYDLGSGCTIHFHQEDKLCNFKYIAWSDRKKGTIEFSDLIIPELTAEEVVDWLDTYYNDESVFIEAFGDDYCFSELCSKFTPKGVVEKIAQWKSDHEKKEPEIETVDICRIIEIQPDGNRKCVHEEDLASDSTDAEIKILVEAELKQYISNHDGEFIAVHEVVSRVKEK